MRRRFHEQLDNLNTLLIEMGSLCEAAINTTIDVLLTGEKEYVEKLVQYESDIDHKEKEIERLCIKLILQQQPMSSDLRQISAALKIITDMERIGDQALDIAEIVDLQHLDPENISENLIKMGKSTSKMVTNAVDAFVKHNTEDAREVIDYDDVIDDYFDIVKKEMVDMIVEDRGNSEHAIDTILIAKYYERIGDHSTNIAEWVLYSVTGQREEE